MQMVDRTRRRVVNDRTAGSHTDRWLSTGAYWFGTNGVNTHFADSRQVTIDETHEWPARKKGRTTRDVGGPFTSTKVSVTADWDLSKSFTIGRTGNNGVLFTGQVLPTFVQQDWDRLDPSKDEALYTYWADSHGVGYLEGLGARAISSTIPTNPHADAAVGVAELMREGFPSLIGSQLFKDKLSFFRNLGSEYLNYEFGWKPFISDLLSIASSIDESEKLLSQLARDSGRNVRRRMSFPTDRETTYTRDSLSFRCDAPSSVLSHSGRTLVTETYHKSWFSGCYTYHYDPADLSEASRIATQARILLGIRIDPEVLWNLTPWSWLVDWFVNLGPVLHNLSAFGQDGLVLRYGYLMHHHTRRTTETHHKVVQPMGGNFLDGTVSAAFRLESKRRIKATPYGFGLTFSSFTLRQWAILASLGITLKP
jgi:hypothetical protein